MVLLERDKRKALRASLFTLALGLEALLPTNLNSATIPSDCENTVVETRQYSSKEEARKSAIKQRNEIKYKSDKENYGVEDYIASVKETLERKSGDCEDIALVVASNLLGVYSPNNLNVRREVAYLTRKVTPIEQHLLKSSSRTSVPEVMNYEVYMAQEDNKWKLINVELDDNKTYSSREELIASAAKQLHKSWHGKSEFKIDEKKGNNGFSTQYHRLFFFEDNGKYGCIGVGAAEDREAKYSSLAELARAIGYTLDKRPEINLDQEYGRREWLIGDSNLKMRVLGKESLALK